MKKLTLFELGVCKTYLEDESRSLYRTGKRYDTLGKKEIKKCILRVAYWMEHYAGELTVSYVFFGEVRTLITPEKDFIEKDMRKFFLMLVASMLENEKDFSQKETILSIESWKSDLKNKKKVIRALNKHFPNLHSSNEYDEKMRVFTKFQIKEETVVFCFDDDFYFNIKNRKKTEYIFFDLEVELSVNLNLTNNNRLNHKNIYILEDVEDNKIYICTVWDFIAALNMYDDKKRNNIIEDLSILLKFRRNKICGFIYDYTINYADFKKLIKQIIRFGLEYPDKGSINDLDTPEILYDFYNNLKNLITEVDVDKLIAFVDAELNVGS